MNVDELLALDRELTEEEFLFLEAECLKAAREFRDHIAALLPEIEAQDPDMAAKLRRSSQSMVDNIEEAVAIPLR